MKKIPIIFLVLTSSIMPISADIFGGDVQIGELYYDIYEENNTAKVTYQSWNYDGTDFNAGWHIKDVTIPEYIEHNGKKYHVTGIGEEAFANCGDLKKVSIPNSVIYINNAAFYRCTNLEDIIIPDSVVHIATNAFEGCIKLRYITIPKGVSFIGENAFGDCSGLESLSVESGNKNYYSSHNCIIETSTSTLIAGCKSSVIPNGVTEIGDFAFFGCNGLKSISIPNSVKRIGEGVFEACTALTSIFIPKSVTSIGKHAFERCTSLEEIKVDIGNPEFDSRQDCNAIIQWPGILIVGCKNTLIPYGITRIGRNAFRGCSSLVNIIIPHSVETIEEAAFADCTNLISVTIGNHVKSIGDGAFSGCSSLKNISLGSGLTTIGGYSFAKCTGLINIVIPPNVTGISDHAFYGCLNLRRISFPISLNYIGSNAFGGCVNLSDICISDIASWCSINMDNDLGYYDPDFGEREIYITNPLHYAANLLLNDSLLEDIKIPEGVRNICNLCCYKKMKSIYIPSSTTSIEYFDSDNLYAINMDEDNMLFRSIDGVLYDKFLLTLLQCPKAAKKNIIIPDGVSKIQKYAFAGCAHLPSVIIPNGIIQIEDSAFYDVTNITCSREIKGAPWGAKSINGYAEGLFVYSDSKKNVLLACSSAASGNIFIPNSVTTIGDGAFKNCMDITSITLPNSVINIKDKAFVECPDIIVYTTNPMVPIPGVPTERIRKVTYQQLYDYPFSSFAKFYVEEGINEWQQKGEYERVSDWQKRVNEQTRQQRISELLGAAEQDYIAHHQNEISVNLTLGKYDADNEVYAITDAQYGDAYVSVPISEAKSFKNNWNNKQLSYQLQIQDDQFQLASLTITLPNGKEYIYRNTDDVKYNLAEIEYNFSPIDLDFASSNTSQNKQNVSITKYKVGQSDVDINIPETDISNPNTFVLIFANEDYKNVSSVPFAKNDGTIFQQYCQKTLGIPHANIHHLENASYIDILLELTWIRNVCEKYEGEASVIFYYAGHGIPDASDKSAYLLPVDGDGRYVATGYKLDELYQKLGDMPTKSVTVILDACFSGANRDGKMLASERGVALKSRPGQPQGNMVVFSAAQSDETALPNNEEKHGMFTYYILKKLQETKGDVTLKDLSDYVIREVGRTSAIINKPQTPTITPAATLGTSWQSWKLK